MAIVGIEKANPNGIHVHYAVTDVKEGKSISVCARSDILPTGPSQERIVGNIHYWYVKEDDISNEEGMRAIEAVIAWYK